MNNRKMVVAVDFDNTITFGGFPGLGKPIPNALEVLKQIQKTCDIIVFTMRTGKELQEAVHFLESSGINLYGVNKNPTQVNWAPDARKVYADFYIDDKGCGVPLIKYNAKDKVEYVVDWKKVSALHQVAHSRYTQAKA